MMSMDQRTQSRWDNWRVAIFQIWGTFIQLQKVNSACLDFAKYMIFFILIAHWCHKFTDITLDFVIQNVVEIVSNICDCVFDIACRFTTCWKEILIGFILETLDSVVTSRYSTTSSIVTNDKLFLFNNHDNININYLPDHKFTIQNLLMTHGRIQWWFPPGR